MLQHRRRSSGITPIEPTIFLDQHRAMLRRCVILFPSPAKSAFDGRFTCRQPKMRFIFEMRDESRANSNSRRASRLGVPPTAHADQACGADYYFAGSTISTTLPRRADFRHEPAANTHDRRPSFSTKMGRAIAVKVAWVAAGARAILACSGMSGA